MVQILNPAFQQSFTLVLGEDFGQTGNWILGIAISGPSDQDECPGFITTHRKLWLSTRIAVQIFTSNLVVGQFAGEPSFNHEGHQGTRRNTFAIKDLGETSCPSWLMPLQFNI
jgi:hypothetical protein